MTDPQRLHQILTNLLANVFKFTEQGQVHVEIGVADYGWSPEIQSLATASSVLAIAVSDTGIGIPPEQHLRVFEAFAKATARPPETTAAPAWASRSAANWSVWLAVRSRWPVSLAKAASSALPPIDDREVSPLPPSRRHRRPPAPVPIGTARLLAPPSLRGPPARDRLGPVDDSALAGARVLVVDDDFRNIFAMTALLERVHAEVTVADNGRDAVAALVRSPGIDIVLMDIMMPVMDGYTTIRAIRALDRFKTIPIIAVTGKVVPGEHRRCVDAGANDYVPKPVDTAELLAYHEAMADAIPALGGVETPCLP